MPRARRLRAKHYLAGGGGILPEPGRGTIRRMGEGHLRRLRRSAIRASPAIGRLCAGLSHTKTRRHEGLCGAGVVHNPPHNAYSRKVGKWFLTGAGSEPQARQGRKRRRSRSWPKATCTAALAYARKPRRADALRPAFEGRKQKIAK